MITTQAGDDVFVVDAHTHFWDGSPANRLNVHGKQFIECFHAFHTALSPPEWVWPLERFEKPDAATVCNDLFVDGHVDVAILQSTYLTEFFRNGFNTAAQNARIHERLPDRFIVNGRFDPRDGERGLDQLRADFEQYGLKGVKLYTAEWHGASKGYRLSDPACYRFLEEWQKLGIRNIHVHKGPTILPLNRDAFDVADVDDVATSFQDLNFIVDHCGIPRLDDFCWIAAQETNVYGGLAAVIPFLHARPGYFAKLISELLFWLGEDKLLFGSDYCIWSPKWIVERFIAYELPEDVRQETGVALTLEAKRKILGLNAARLYGIDTNARLEPVERMHA
jgi:predicted TIM-barrel fold metal-dependent hydrolase